MLRAETIGAARTGVLLGLGLLAAGCAARGAPAGRAPVRLNAADAWAAARRRDERILSLRVRFSAAVRQAGGERRAQGVLLVKKPDRFRVRLLSPLGMTVFDYTSRAAHARLELPLAGESWTDDDIESHAPFAPHQLEDALLRDAGAAPETCVPQAADTAVVVRCRGADGALRREIFLQAGTATVTREVGYADGRPRLTIRFADYREAGGVLLPYRIELEDAVRGVTLFISVKGYELNPPLPDALFQ